MLRSSSAGGPASAAPSPSRDAAAGGVPSRSSAPPRYAARTVSSRCTSAGVPTEMTRPKSSTWIRSHVPMTKDMSCSTSSTARPEPATSRNNSPRVDVSVSFKPADGSSSRSTRAASPAPDPARRGGRCRSGAGRHGRRRPPGARRARGSRRRRPPAIGSDRAPTPAASLPRRGRSRAVRLPKVSSRWNVRPIPSRARWWGLRRVMSRPSSSTRPELGPSRPVTTLKSVVLPAPLGPMRPVT